MRSRFLHPAGALFLLLAAIQATAAGLPDRRHVLVVGSSTAYPIIAAAAERIGRAHAIPTPVIESTGTGGGIKLFCGGYGLHWPDIAMASRRMKESERNACTGNKVNDVREVKIGYDGIVIAANKNTPPLRLSKRDLYLAMARVVPSADDPSRLIANPHHQWNDIDPDLPAQPIRIMGPPPTSGTRDILVERVLEPGCLATPGLLALRAQDPALFAERCRAVREDGAYIDAGENDARLVRKLLTDPDTLAMLGYSFLDRNRDRLRAASIDGVEPSYETIESGVYPLTRPLFLYIKPQHAKLVEGLDTFVDALIGADISGPEGYLIDRGLIPLTAMERTSSGSQ